MEMNETGKPTALLDIMVKNSYKGQLKYYKHGHPELINGKIVEVFDMEDIRNYVEEHRPSLKGKDFIVEFSNQKVI